MKNKKIILKRFCTLIICYGFCLVFPWWIITILGMIIGFNSKSLFQALVDSTNLENPNVTRANHAKEAIKWIFENRKDFETVCGLSGFDPDYFRTRAKKFIKARYSAELLGSVFATHRKNLWR